MPGRRVQVVEEVPRNEGPCPQGFVPLKHRSLYYPLAHRHRGTKRLGLRKDVHRFCSACPTCHRVSPLPGSGLSRDSYPVLPRAQLRTLLNSSSRSLTVFSAICRSPLSSSVTERGHASQAGVCEGDEVVSLNGEPCAEVTLQQAISLINASTDCLQLLLKRSCSSAAQDFEPEDTFYGERPSSSEAFKSTTLRILSPHRSQASRELCLSESQGEAHSGQAESGAEVPKGCQLVRTHLSVGGPLYPKENDGRDEPRESFSPLAMVEFQVSLAGPTLEGTGYTSLGSARGIAGVLQPRESTKTLQSTAQPLSKTRECLGQHGVVLRYPSALEHPAEAQPGGRSQALGDGGSAHRTSGRIGAPEEGEDVGGHSFTVSFGIPSEGAEPAEEWDSDSERDQDKPNKHRAKHARLRRSESLSEKQVKEAKSKCKRIALLLSAAPPNPNNKGVLMFKRHRQRAKKYTLVSYGTGGNEPEFEDDEKEAVEFTLIATSDSELDEDFFTDAQAGGSVLTFDWDKGLLEIERKLSAKEEMENLSDTKGKGALMFAQRRVRMDEIAAEHEELRRQGIAVESVQEAEKLSAYHKMEEHSYMQATTERQTYMDVNMHQQSQHQQSQHHQQQQPQQHQPQQQQQQPPPQQQYQQYQEQQYYEQQQQYQQQYQQQQQQQQQYQQHYQQQQYEQQQQYHQQQMHSQQHEYQQSQQQIQQCSANMNGGFKQQTDEMQSSISNRSAKPFSVQDVVPPSSLPMSGTNKDAMGQGEEIASRDERISTPAIKTGILQDTRRRNTAMFSFKETPKVSPNPALLNLLNKREKKLGCESGPEEDYLSLGAEACNFLQPSQVKHKNPPPVAPKPVINPNSPPWAQLDGANQDASQHDENSVSAPATAPTTVCSPAFEPEPTPIPAAEPSPPLAPQEVPANPSPQEQHTWAPPEPAVPQQPQAPASWEGNAPTHPPSQPEPPVNTWAPSQVQPQAPAPSPSPPQLPWVTHQQQPQTKPQSPPQNAWTPAPTQPQVQPQVQPPWPQLQEQTQSNVPPAWAQAQEQQPPQQVQPPWTQPLEQTKQPVQQPWAQPQEKPQQLQPPWAQPQEQLQQQVQPPWAQPQEQPQQQIQPPWTQPQEQQPPQVQPPWAQPQEQQPPQVQPPWVQPQEQQPPQVQPPWAQPQEQQPPQVQPPWAQPQEQQPPQVQPPWAQPQEQQPPWVQQAPLQSQPQPPWIQQQQPQPQTWSHPQAQPQPPWIASAQPQQQPSMNSWTPQQNQSQSQPPWVQPVQPQAPLNPWAPVPVQPQPQYNSWTQEQKQPHWAPPGPNQSPPQPNWQQPTSQEQTPNSAWASVPTQPQASQDGWNQQTNPPPTPMMNHRGPPSSLKPPHTPTPPPAVQRINSYTAQERSSSPINPMASVLNPSATGSAFEMPAVKGKGAELFAKRLSRMEKFVVDSDTVQANKASRPTSPASAIPHSWKYSPNVRAPPPLSYNPILSPSYPPGAMKQPPPASPLAKAKNKEKKKPAPKPLAVIDVMKHQPYQLDASLFTYGPAVEAAKALIPKPAPAPAPAPPVQNQVIRYEQVAPVQTAGSMNTPYAQHPYGMPPQPPMHDGHYNQPQANAYPQAPHNPYQQVPGGPYQQAYNPQYHQAPPAPYQPQAPNPPYQQPAQAPYPQPAQAPYPQPAQAPYPQPAQAPYQPAHSPPYQPAHSPPYQPAHSPPYQVAPTAPYQAPPPSTYVVPSFPVAARPDSLSGGSVSAAPKPKFMAKKSSGQALGRSYSLSPPARLPFMGIRSASASSSPKPPPRATPGAHKMPTLWMEMRSHKPPTPWEAASRHPLGLVDEAFAFQNLQQSIATNVYQAAQRKLLPEPPAEWKARVSYHPPQKPGASLCLKQNQKQSQSHAFTKPFVSPTKSTASAPAYPAGGRSLYRGWQPQRSLTETNIGPSVTSWEHKKTPGKPSYRAGYTTAKPPPHPLTHRQLQCRKGLGPTQVTLPSLTPLVFPTSFREDTGTS
ncbi:uncharacterized protein synpo2a [Aplochiton taeniatus]